MDTITCSCQNSSLSYVRMLRNHLVQWLTKVRNYIVICAFLSMSVLDSVCPEGDSCPLSHYCSRGSKCMFLKQGRCKFIGSALHQWCCRGFVCFDILQRKYASRRGSSKGKSGGWSTHVASGLFTFPATTVTCYFGLFATKGSRANNWLVAKQIPSVVMWARIPLLFAVK